MADAPAKTDVDEAIEASDDSAGTPAGPSSLSRFALAAASGMVVAAIPFFWLLWDMWTGTVHLTRIVYNSDFYDAQARAIMHGHLWVQKAVLDVEAFRHGSHYYTYFGIFPSLLRIPLLFVAPNLYGRLTTAALTIAWLMTGVISAMLIWRVRILVRGEAVLGRMEALGCGLLVASVCGGSVWLLLASMPWVYHEDMAWSIALTLGALFALVGVLERPSRGRVWALGVFVVAASLNRLPTGYACVTGTILVAAWFASGRGGEDRRRWWIPLVLIAVVAVVLSCIVNVLKFGVPFGLPLGSEVVTAVNAHRRAFLARSGGRGYGLGFFPTTMWTYFQPLGIRWQSVFPFVTLPGTPPKILAGAFFDQTYRTASVPASMPLLFLLCCWGVICSFSRRARNRTALLRIPLFAGALCFGVALVWGFIAARFESDLLPLLALGSAAGLFHLWGTLEARNGRGTGTTVGAVSALAVYGLVANFGIAAVPIVHWSPTQTRNFVQTQLRVSNLTGHPIDAHVVHGTHLPYYAPAGTLYIAGDCSGLYISTGESYASEPVQQNEHDTWLPVEQAAQINHLFHVTFGRTGSDVDTTPVPLVSSGPYTVFVSTPAKNTARFTFRGPGTDVVGNRIMIHPHSTHPVSVTLDPNLDLVNVVFDQGGVLSAVLPRSSPVTDHSSQSGSGGSPAPIEVVPARARPQGLRICRSLLRSS